MKTLYVVLAILGVVGAGAGILSLSRSPVPEPETATVKADREALRTDTTNSNQAPVTAKFNRYPK